MKSPQSKHIRLLQEKYQENLEVMFKNLLKDESLSDVTIYCKDGAVRGHKVILAACSSYFKKIFYEHPEPQVVFMVHGVSIKHMKSLIELMYRGSTDVSPELMSKLCEIAEDFGVKGIIDENERTLTSAGRDTRYRGQKRVAVDFESLESHMKSSSMTSLKNGLERRLSSCSDKSSRKSLENIYTSTSTTSSPSSTMGASDLTTPLLAQVKLEPQSPSVSSGHSSVQLSAEARRRHNWAMKQRKYKCILCPASFKRASHLTRHQLVHTGERPFTCDQCDKAFSRHDKLKHHIRKAHEPHFDDVLDPSDLYTIGRVEILTPRMELSEDPDRVTREDLMPRTSLPAKLPKLEPEETSTPNPRYLLPRPAAQSAPPPVVDPLLPVVPQKKGRGRPRKHPPTPRPLIKRPRGRPRINPAAPRPLIKRPRGRPRLNQSAPTPQPANTSTPMKTEPENYDITNMPFGDLEYLTKPFTMRENTEQFEDSSSAMEPNLMEPLVEIQMDQTDQQEKPEQVIHHTAGSFLQNIGLLENTHLANIGECTISLSSSSSS